MFKCLVSLSLSIAASTSEFVNGRLSRSISKPKAERGAICTERWRCDRSGILLFFGYAAGWALAQQNLLIKSVLEITKAMQTGAAAPLTWTFYLIVAIAAVLTFVGIFLIDSGLQSYYDGTCCGVVGLWGCVGGGPVWGDLS